MIRLIKGVLRAVANVFVRLWVGDPRSPYEKIVFDASRQMARQFGGVL